VTAAL